jgi:hypothetical protein
MPSKSIQSIPFDLHLRSHRFVCGFDEKTTAGSFFFNLLRISLFASLLMAAIHLLVFNPSRNTFNTLRIVVVPFDVFFQEFG